MRLGPARLLLLALALIGPAGLPAGGSAARAQIDGQTYVSPTYGYRIAWDAVWLVTDELSEFGTDTLVLTNGPSYVQFLGRPWDGGGAESCPAAWSAALARQGGVAGIQPLALDAEAPNRAAFSYTITFADGSTLDLVDDVECRPLLGGAAMLQIVSSTPLADFEAQLPLLDELRAGVEVPSPGERGPAFVAGRWRIAVAAAVRAAAIDAVRLKATEDKEWVLVVADVTNWGDGAATFDPEDATLTLDEGARRAELAVRSTDGVARRLAIAPEDPEAGVELAADETVRLALVFRVAATADGPELTLADERLPLTDVLSADDGVLDALPALVGPPELEEAEVERVVDGNRLEITLPDGSEQTVDLIGVDAPLGDECFADEAAGRLDDVAPETVFLEQETPGDEDDERYVWIEGRRGTRVLLNHDLVAGGFAAARDGADGRFRTWLGAAAAGARTDGTGLWGACTGPHGDELPEEEATPASPTPTA